MPSVVGVCLGQKKSSRLQEMQGGLLRCFLRRNENCWEQPIDVVLVVTHSPHLVMLTGGTRVKPVLPGHGASTAAPQGVW